MPTTTPGKYADLVKRETEPDDDEGEGDGDEEGDAETKASAPAEPQAMGEVDAERMGKQVEKANTAYRNALGRIDGLAFDAFAECGNCNGMGFVPPDFTPPPPLLDAPDKALCDGCNGYGVQLTPSLDEHHRLEQCVSCQGNGWKIRPIPEPQLAFQSTAQGAGFSTGGVTIAAANGPQAAPPRDAWERPLGHPHFGIPPAQLGV